MTCFESNELTGDLMKAARILARKSVEEVAQAAGLGVATIKRAEANRGAVTMTRANAACVIRTFNELGIVFISSGDGGVGLLLK